MSHHRVVVLGGGNGGLSVAGRLRRAGVPDVLVIDPRETHIFQPLQSHVAGGAARASQATRPQADVIPRGVTWHRDAAVDICPDSRTVTLASGGSVTYEHLVVAIGMERRWDAVPGVVEAMATPTGVSNYEHDLAAKTSLVLRDVSSGTVVFTQSPGPASCAGAAQKPMYLACDWWRARGVLDDIRVVLVVPEPTIYGIPEIDAELERKIDEYGIEVRYDADLLHVDPVGHEVTIGRADRNETLSYDVLHVEPPQSAPTWLASTPVTAASGFIDTDPETLRHRRYPDVWALGDVAEVAASRSGGALRRQSKVLARNLLAAMKGRPLPARYDGYSVCPFTVSRHTVVFAEFDRTGRLRPTVPFWRTLYRERRLSWILDRYVLPWVYWHLILQGRA